jgi:hypothetical protein
MRKNDGGLRAAVRRRALVAGMASIAAVAALAGASPALAAPQGIFSEFADCPTNIPVVTLCQYGTITSGEIALGSLSVPINKTITLQDGTVETGKKLNEYFLFPVKDGNSLSKTELNVPGGLPNLVDCDSIKGHGFVNRIKRRTCEAIFGRRAFRVTATAELVANEKNPPLLDLANLIFEEGPGTVLPIRVHLKSPLLGPSCYIGSEASPIELQLTTGTTSPPSPNQPIKGQVGTPGVEEENGNEVDSFKGLSLVDNAFSVPVAEGCGGIFSFFVDPLLDSKLGLPSAAGNSTVILSGTFYTTASASVLASEKS